MIRVLHIIPGKLYGGVESAMVTLARFRHCCSAMITEAAVCWRGRLSEELEAAGIAVHVVGAVRARNPLTVWSARRRLHEVLKRNRFDAVICHMPWVLAVFGPAIRAANTQLVFRAHGVSNPRHWIERWARMTPPDLILAVSRFVASDIARLHPGVPLKVVYNPVPPAEALTAAQRAAMRARLNTPADAIVIAQAGRMQSGKGQQILLAALAQLRDNPRWQCWQIGGAQTPREAAYLDELKQQATRLRIGERVHFLGPRTGVPRLLAASDIYCQPNDTFAEGMGIGLVEAMHAGLPIITTAIGAAPEVLGNDGGFLLPPRDSESVAQVLRKMIGDPAARIAQSARARLHAKRFAPELVIPDLASTLAPPLAAPATGRSLECAAQTPITHPVPGPG